MVFLVAVALAFSLGHGHRIQPIAVMRQNQLDIANGKSGGNDLPQARRQEDIRQKPSIATTTAGPAPNASADVADPVQGQSLDKQQQMKFEHLARFASMIQTHVEMVPSHDAFAEYPRLVLGIIVGMSVMAVYLCGCCLMQNPSWSRKKGRMQYVHNDRVVYEWEQTSKVAAIYIRPPAGITKNELDIKIAARCLRVGRKGKPAFIREETYDLVNEEMSSWSLRSNGELQIFLQKAQKAEWPAVLLHNADKLGGANKLPPLPIAKNSKTRQEKQPTPRVGA